MTDNSEHLPPWVGAIKAALLPRLRTALTVVLFSVAGIIMAHGQSPSPTASPAATDGLRLTPAPADLPPFPTHWFSDYAKVTSPIFAIGLDRRLERFERETTNQFRVVIYPKLPPGADLADYCTRVAKTWGIGRKGINNGVVLFVFVEDHKVRLSVGRGLEATLTDPASQKIIDAMLPFFRKGDFEGGLSSAVESVINTLPTGAQVGRPSS